MSKPLETRKTSSPYLSLGLYATASQLLRALIAKNHITNEVKEMMRKEDFILPARDNPVIHAVAKSVSALGFPTGNDYEHICAAGIMDKLFLCPAEMGPLLRIGWKSQPVIERKKVRLAMEPITTSHGKYIFYLSRDRYGPCLGAEEIWRDDFYGPDEHFVFAVPYEPSAAPRKW